MITNKQLHKIGAVWCGDKAIRSFFHRVVNKYELSLSLAKDIEAVLDNFKMGFVGSNLCDQILDCYIEYYAVDGRLTA